MARNQETKNTSETLMQVAMSSSCTIFGDMGRKATHGGTRYTPTVRKVEAQIQSQTETNPSNTKLRHMGLTDNKKHSWDNYSLLREYVPDGQAVFEPPKHSKPARHCARIV